MDLPLMDRAQVDSRIRSLIEPFNKKRVAIADDTTFAGDLEFDIIISMNQQAEIENYGQLVDAVCKLQAE
jgi:acyl carrier protein